MVGENNYMIDELGGFMEGGTNKKDKVSL